MTGIVRRINLLTALALLVSGLLQPLAAAQGVVCARTHAPAQEALRPASAQVAAPASASDRSRVATAPHQHDAVPQPAPASAPSAPCGVAAVPCEQCMPSPAVTARQVLDRGDQPPVGLFIQSLFRPPRLS